MRPPRTPIRKPPVDPFAPMSSQQMQEQRRSLFGRLPMRPTNAQIQTQAQGMLDPVVQRLTQGYETQGRNAAAQIGGYSNALANDLATSGPAGVRAAYAPAEQATAAASAALANRISGAGSATADDLARRLASIGDPTVQQTTDTVRGDAAGAANAGYAGGVASLEQLIGNHATASDYAAKLPALARLSGVQQIGQETGAINKQLGDSLTQTYGQLPSIVQNLRTQADANAFNKAQLASDLYQSLTGQNITKATAKAGFNTDLTKLATDTQPLPDASLSKTYGYIVDQYGNPILGANGKPQKVAVPPHKAAKPKDTSGKQQSAVTAAESTVAGYFQKTAVVSSTNQATGEKVNTRIKVGSPTYNERISRAVALIHDSLSPYMTDAQIRAYVIGKSKAFFAPAGP